MNFGKFTFFWSFEVTTKDKTKFLNSWQELKTNLEKTYGLADARLYSEVAGKKNPEELYSGIIIISWYSLNDFISALQTIEFRDFIQNFIQKWDIKEAPFTSYSLIRKNKFFQMPTRISNDFFMVIFLLVAAIIVWIILFYLR